DRRHRSRARPGRACRPRHRREPGHRPGRGAPPARPRRVGDHHRPQAPGAGRRGGVAGRGRPRARRRGQRGRPGGAHRGRRRHRRPFRCAGRAGQQHRHQPAVRPARGRRPRCGVQDLRGQRGGRARFRAGGAPRVDGRARRRDRQHGLGGRAALQRGHRGLRGVEGGVDPSHRGAGVGARSRDPGQRGGARGGQDAVRRGALRARGGRGRRPLPDAPPRHPGGRRRARRVPGLRRRVLDHRRDRARRRRPAGDGQHV
ncbi:MAG: 3-oxoacyl-[acyl-carrier protein] reductase, partial [uncultured Actinomycetospora sp.]